MEDKSVKTEEETKRVLGSAAQRFAEVLILYLEETGSFKADTSSISEEL